MITAESLLYVFLSVGVFSYALWKETPYFRLCEHMLLGVTMGYVLVSTVKTLLNTAINPLTTKGDLLYLVPIVLGLALYTRFKKETKWISKIPIALIVGVGIALSMRGVISTYIISQLKATAMAKIFTNDMLTNINNLIIVFTVILVTWFFTFTFITDSKNHVAVNYSRRIARYLIMISLGAFFASIAQSHLTLLASAVQRILMGIGII